jgi:AcrR family transcriptional regulator
MLYLHEERAGRSLMGARRRSARGRSSPERNEAENPRRESPSLIERLATAGILRAAIETFSRQGFAATRVEDILEAANVARRTFYKHFGNKEEVLAAVYKLATDELTQSMRRAAGGDGDPLDAVRRAVDAYLDYHVANSRLVAVLVQQAVRTDSPLFVHRQQFREDLVQLLDMAVRAATGERHDPLLYMALISAVEGTSLDLLSGECGPDEVARAKKVLHLILDRTIAKPEPVQ